MAANRKSTKPPADKEHRERGEYKNYRQWEKNYKKQHGYNPPLEEDKRKRARLEAQQLSISLPQITESLNNLMPNICRALASACETISNGFTAAGKTFGEMAENYDTGAVHQYRESGGTA